MTFIDHLAVWMLSCSSYANYITLNISTSPFMKYAFFASLDGINGIFMIKIVVFFIILLLNDRF